MENSNDPIGNRTRYLSACSSVPHPTAAPHTHPLPPPPPPKKVLKILKLCLLDGMQENI